MQSLDRGVLLLAHKLPGAERRLSVTDSLSPLTRGVSCDCQDGQCTLNRHAHHLLLWAQDKFLSLRAVHVLGVLNLAADFVSRPKLRLGEWMLNRQTVAQIWDLFDLQVLSVSEMCMVFAPGLVYVTLWPMFLSFYPHRFALRWSHCTLSILLTLLQETMKGFTCFVLSEL